MILHQLKMTMCLWMKNFPPIWTNLSHCSNKTFSARGILYLLLSENFCTISQIFSWLFRILLYTWLFLILCISILKCYLKSFSFRGDIICMIIYDKKVGPKNVYLLLEYHLVCPFNFFYLTFLCHICGNSFACQKTSHWSKISPVFGGISFTWDITLRWGDFSHIKLF